MEETDDMKRALVLSGGGSRGAYEIGAWQALAELGVRLDAVYGTSIGAINAALVAQGDLDLAKELWAHITVRQIVATDEEDFSIDRMVSRKRDVVPFLLENHRRLRMDITPLENMVAKYLNEGRVRASGMELGVMTVRAPQLQPVPVRLSEMPEGQLADWVIASASCFPIFPTRRIGGERYVDGGYYDNLPIDMAIADGAEEIVAVELHPGYTHPEYARMPFLRTIKPLNDLGGFLDFNPKLLARARRLGYCDAMKAHRALDGVRYAFTVQSDLHVAPPARKFARRVAAFDAESVSRAALHAAGEADAPLISAICRETPLRALTWKEAYLRGLELCAEKMGFREDAIYDPEALTKRMLGFARVGEAVERMDERGVRMAARMGARELISYLYRALAAQNEIPVECVRMLAEYPEETAAALYLRCAEEG